MKKNKKAMLLASETLKVVVAVICISLLIYLLFSIFYSSSNTEKLKQARATLDKISEWIVEVELNPSVIGKIDNVNPLNWYFFGFISGEPKPNQCAGKSCICICKIKAKTLGSLTLSKQTTKCTKKGECLIVENLGRFNEIYVERDSSTNLEIINEGGLIKLRGA